MCGVFAKAQIKIKVETIKKICRLSGLDKIG